MLRNFLLALALVLVASLYASGQGDKVGYTYCPRGEQYLYLYDSVSTFNVLANLKCGERVDIIGSENGYAIVRTVNGRQGYVPLEATTSRPPVKAPGARESATSRLPQPGPAEPSKSTAKVPAAESATSRLPEPGPAEPPKPTAKVPAAESATSRLPEPGPAEPPKPTAKVPAAESATSRLPEPGPAEPPKPTAKVPAAESATSRLPEPVPVEPSTPLATPPPAREAPIIRAPERVPAEISGPRAEIFGGYSYLNFDTNRLASRQNFNGWESSLGFNVNRWLAAEASVSGYYKSYSFDLTALGLSRLKANVHDYDFLGGPHINFQPVFFHVLLGIEHLTANASGYSASENSFAAALGGGGQWRIAGHRQWSVRASADYFLTRHNLLNAQLPINQNNIRISAGVVYTFRARSE